MKSTIEYWFKVTWHPQKSQSFLSPCTSSGNLGAYSGCNPWWVSKVEEPQKFGLLRHVRLKIRDAVISCSERKMMLWSNKTISHIQVLSRFLGWHLLLFSLRIFHVPGLIVRIIISMIVVTTFHHTVVERPHGNNNPLLWYRWTAHCLLVVRHQVFIYFYRTQVSLGSDLWVRFSLTEWGTLLQT